MPDDLSFANVDAPAPESRGPEPLLQSVKDAIQTVYDPEIPVNIWELGLIYKVDVSDGGDVAVDMTLTTPACPSAQELPAMVEEAVSDVPGVRSCTVEIVWEPMWSPARMSEVAKLELGFL